MDRELYLEGMALRMKSSPSGRAFMRSFAVARLNDKEYYLQERIFVYLVKLAMRRVIDASSTDHQEQFGFVRRDELEPRSYDNAAKYIYHLRRQIPVNILNDRAGSYCLDFPVDRIKFNRQNLSRFPHAEVRGMFV